MKYPRELRKIKRIGCVVALFALGSYVIVARHSGADESDPGRQAEGYDIADPALEIEIDEALTELRARSTSAEELRILRDEFRTLNPEVYRDTDEGVESSGMETSRAGKRPSRILREGDPLARVTEELDDIRFESMDPVERRIRNDELRESHGKLLQEIDDLETEGEGGTTVGEDAPTGGDSPRRAPAPLDAEQAGLAEARRLGAGNPELQRILMDIVARTLPRESGDREAPEANPEADSPESR